MSDIVLDKLVKFYDNGFQAVKGIDLTIKDKEFMVLVGPSGCGKTTSLRMVAGLEDISGGEVRIAGKRVNEVMPKDRDIAMVFQSYALYPHMSVYENMAFALRLKGTPKHDIHLKVTKAAGLLNLTSQLEKLPKQLSGGQRQRVALGRAIVRQPKAFLFDEPLSNLDAKLRGEMRYELKKLQRDLATTAIYVTHDQVEAMTLGDRITVMSVGEIQQVAAPTVVYDFPYNRFVASFIGTPPMNFLPGTLTQANGTWTCTVCNGKPVVLHVENQTQLATNAGKEVVLGIRSEHMHLAATAPQGSSSIDMQVDVVEHMGDHQYVYLRAPGLTSNIIMKAPAKDRFSAGANVPVFFDSAHAHIFADTSEHALNITLPVGFQRQQ